MGISSLLTAFNFWFIYFTFTVGVDYTNRSGELRVNPYDDQPCFPVNIINDNTYRTGRRFFYTLESHDPQVIVRGTRGVVEISDDDMEKVTIGFEKKDYIVTEGESVDVCVWMTAGFIGQPITVHVGTGRSSTINYCELISGTHKH